MSRLTDVPTAVADYTPASSVDDGALSLSPLSALTAPVSEPSLLSRIWEKIKDPTSLFRSSDPLKAAIADTLNDLQFACRDLNGTEHKLSFVRVVKETAAVEISSYGASYSRVGSIIVQEVDQRKQTASSLLLTGNETLFSAEFFESLVELGLLDSEAFCVREVVIRLPSDMQKIMENAENVINAEKPYLQTRQGATGVSEYRGEPPRSLTVLEALDIASGHDELIGKFLLSLEEFIRMNDFNQIAAPGVMRAAGYIGYDARGRRVHDHEWAHRVEVEPARLYFEHINLSRPGH